MASASLPKSGEVGSILKYGIDELVLEPSTFDAKERWSIFV